jgi:hypothetical protein
MREVTREEFWEHHAQGWERAGYPIYAASCRANKTGRKGRRAEYRISA